MAFDLDDEELEATRKMHKGSDINVGTIEEDIERLNKLVTTKFINDYSIDNVDKEAIEHLLQDYKRQKQINKELEIDLTIVYLKGIEDGKDKYEQKIKNKIKEIGNEDLGVYDTDSEDVVIAKYEHRAVLDTLNELLQESEDK